MDSQGYELLPWSQVSGRRRPGHRQRRKEPLESRFPSLRQRQRGPTLDFQQQYEAKSSDTDLLTPANIAGLEEPRQEATQNRQQAAAWRPGFWRRMPALAVAALLGVVLCTAAAVGVLVYSDGRDVDAWGTLTPSVILASLSVVSNSLLAVALTDGLVISFWRTIVQGCTLDEAHANWEGGASFWGAVSHGYRSHGVVSAIARILTFLSLIRSPLFQRATSVRANVQHSVQGDLSAQVAQKLPDGYAGVHIYDRGVNPETAMLTDAFNTIMNDFSLHNDMLLEQDDCKGTCFATIKGFGYQAECRKGETSFVIGAAGTEYTEFDTSISLYGTDEKVDYLPMHAFTAGILIDATYCEGNYGSIVAYNATIQGQVVTLSPRAEDKYLQPLTLLSPGQDADSVIGGFQYAADYLYSSSAVLRYGGAVSSVVLSGSLANQVLKNGSGLSYAYVFGDPMDIILDGIREIAFRASLKAGKEEDKNITQADQQVTYTGFVTRNIFVTEYLYLGIAVTINLIGFLAVGSTFWGWWSLGRNFSFNPLEIAKAFDSPLLSTAGSNIPFKKYPDDLKKSKIQYGAISMDDNQSDSTTQLSDGGKRYLVAAPVDVIHRPTVDTVYH